MNLRKIRLIDWFTSKRTLSDLDIGFNLFIFTHIYCYKACSAGGWAQYGGFGYDWAPPMAESHRDQGEGEGFPPWRLAFLGLSGFNLDAGPSGPCLGRDHSVVLGLLQSRSACVSEPVSQAARPHGRQHPRFFSWGCSIRDHSSGGWSPWVFAPLGCPFAY